nr:skin secretory protein xP2-like [Aegilops tauschii subsp. strangulata]
MLSLLVSRPPSAGVAALSDLVDGGLGLPRLGCLPSPASDDVAPASAAPSTLIAAVGAPSPTPAGAITSSLAPAEAPPPSAATAEAPSTSPAGSVTSSSTPVKAMPSSTPVGTSPDLGTKQPVSWSSLTKDEEGEDDDELAPQTPPPATKSPVPRFRLLDRT